MTPLKAIRKFCLDCCSNQSREVTLCNAEKCPLLPLRFGRGVKGLSALKTIRAKCFDCGEGTYLDIKNCSFDECPLFPYRYGKNPALKGKRGNPEALLKAQLLKKTPVIQGLPEKKAIVEKKAIAMAFAFFFSLLATPAQASPIPANLYQSIIAEDTSGNLETYRVIASVVRNRLQKGLNLGLVALKRPNLAQFVSKEVEYAKAARGLNLAKIAQQAIDEVFEQGRDYSNGGDHYEHTGHYPVPKWSKGMRVVKILYPNTTQELTCWEGR